MITRIFFIFFIFFAGCCEVFAGNPGFGVHSGYGILKFEEKETFFGDNFESKSRQKAFLFGVSGEYSFPRHENFYTGLVTDWLIGLEDGEIWKENGTKFQTDDMRFLGQFYDLRMGYKNNLENFYYRIYLSGGWDGMRLRRTNFIENSVAENKTLTEDFSLWRTGTGFGLGYRADKWTFDGRAAYSYYPEGRTKDSSLPQYTFDTNGTCLDAGFGASRGIAKNMNFYLGVNYTLQKLKGTEPLQAISWKSTLEVLVGVVSLTYAF